MHSFLLADFIATNDSPEQNCEVNEDLKKH